MIPSSDDEDGVRERGTKARGQGIRRWRVSRTGDKVSAPKLAYCIFWGVCYAQLHIRPIIDQ